MTAQTTSGGDAAIIENKAQLIEWLEAGCKPRDSWRVGTEHEKFPFFTDTLRPVPYDGERSIRALLAGLRACHADWEPIMEGDCIIGLLDTAGGGCITLEPAGQFELSGAPLANIHQTCTEVHTHFSHLRTVADPLGIGFLGIGASPLWTRDETPVMP
ncbi:MAG TPA: glutamate--cysteine ligase, partial [Thermopetrobacter sp.]|nr:glutamate--cysteine ligase [Thermopetrobacter sp.]